MPLRDHFRLPVASKHSWDSLHGMWPAMIVKQLFEILPSGYVSAPNVHFGRDFEIDVSTFEETEPSSGKGAPTAGGDIEQQAGDGESVDVEGIVRAFLDVPIRESRGEIHERMVPKGDAEPAGAGEESGPDAEASRATYTELVSSEGRGIERRCGGT